MYIPALLAAPGRRGVTLAALLAVLLVAGVPFVGQGAMMHALVGEGPLVILYPRMGGVVGAVDSAVRDARANGAFPVPIEPRGVPLD